MAAILLMGIAATACWRLVEITYATALQFPATPYYLAKLKSVSGSANQ